MTRGEPAWLATIGHNSAAQVAHQGLTASVVLAALLILIAIGVYLAPPAARVALALAAGAATALWVAGQALGGILTGSGTDPGSGPLLILLVLAYWPVRTGGRGSDDAWSDQAKSDQARSDQARSDGARSDQARSDGARSIRGPAAGRAVT